MKTLLTIAVCTLVSLSAFCGEWEDRHDDDWVTLDRFYVEKQVGTNVLTVVTAAGDSEAVIQWGDGAVTKGGGTKTHTYADTNNVYVASIRGATTLLAYPIKYRAPIKGNPSMTRYGGSSGAPNNYTLGSVPYDLFYGTPNLNSLNAAFQFHGFLTGVMPDLSKNIKLTTLQYAFYQTGITGTITGKGIEFLTALTSLRNTWGRSDGITGGLPDIGGLTNLNNIDQAWYLCNKLNGTIPALTNLTKLTVMSGTWNGCTGLTGSIPDISGLTNLTTIASAWQGCAGLTGSIPDISGLTNLMTIASAWRGCGELTGSIPDISGLTNLTSIGSAFQDTRKLTGAIPSLSQLKKLTDMASSFYFDILLTGPIPDISGLTNLTTLDATFLNCEKLTGTIPDISGLTNLTTLNGTFYGCAGITGAAPNISNLKKVTSIQNMYRNVRGLTGPISDISGLTNLTSIAGAWESCTNLTGDMSVIFTSTNVGLPKLTTSALAFNNHYKLVGEGMRFVNMPKGPSYTTNGGSSSSSYRTFFNCTNLSDYAIIPAEYK